MIICRANIEAGWRSGAHIFGNGKCEPFADYSATITVTIWEGATESVSSVSCQLNATIVTICERWKQKCTFLARPGKYELVANFSTTMARSLASLPLYVSLSHCLSLPPPPSLSHSLSLSLSLSHTHTHTHTPHTQYTKHFRAWCY